MLNITRFSYYILPSVFQGMLGFLVLPFATNILNPEDYGLFALAMALAVLGSNIASAPMSYLIVSDFRGDKDSLQPSGKQRVTTSVLIMYMGLVSLVVMGIISLWPYLQQIEPTFQKVNKVAFLLTMVSLVFQGLWALTSTIITVEGKAKIYAAGLIGQSIVGATTLLLCLFAFNLGVISLFVSVVFGQFVLVAASFFAIWPYLVLYFDKKILQRMLSLFPASTMGGLVESCNTFVERYMLVMIGGLAGLGIYSHSLIYRSMLLQIFKAAARALWPDLLQELRSQEISLQNITVSYRLIRMIIGLIAIVVFLYFILE